MENWYLKYCFSQFFFFLVGERSRWSCWIAYFTSSSQRPSKRQLSRESDVCVFRKRVYLAYISFWGGEGKFKLCYYIYKPRSKARIDTLLACLQLFMLSQFLRLSALQAQPIKWCHTHSGSVFLPQITINKTPERRTHSQQLSNADSSSIKTLPGWS